MKLTYLGQCGFLVEIAGTRIVTDPYLSDSIERWTRAYAPPCTLAELKPDLVVISHSHIDHMDPATLGAYRAAGGNCAIAAPAPECAPLESLGFENIIYARAEQPFDIGRVRVTPIMCAHTEPHTDDAGRFRELSYFIEADGEKLFFGGDFSLYDGVTQRLAAEKPAYIIIPANGRDEVRTANDIIGNTHPWEAAQLAKACGATLIPSHYDLYSENGCAPEEIRSAASEIGAKLLMPEPGAAFDA
jgi:L-ascorbate metabolism protein UlaG (beta-lactamase superfamily)